MPITFSDGLQNNSPKPLDNKYGRFVGGSFRAYTSVAEANSTISSAYRYLGLTVLIGDGTNNQEYYYATSVLDNGLVPKISNIDNTKTAYVSTTGNNLTGQVSKPGLPFFTLNAALDALNVALPTGGGVLEIAVGDYTFPDKSKIKNNTTFKGAGKPVPNWVTSVPAYGSDTRSAPTKLVGGTVIKGPLDFSLKDGIIIYDLGVDCGSDWCTASNAGVGENALVCGQFYNLSGGQSASDGVHSIQSDSRPRFGVVIRNVAALCKDASTPYHAAVLENLYNFDVIGLTTYFGLHGIVFKGITGIASNLQAYGHSGEGLIIKSNDYANTYNIVVSNVSVSDIGGVGGGITLQNEAPSPTLFGINLSNFNVMHTTYGLKTIGLLDDCLITNGEITLINGNGFDSPDGLTHSQVSNVNIRNCTGTGFILKSNSLGSVYNSISNISSIGNAGNFDLDSLVRLDVSNIYSYLGTGVGIAFGRNIFATGVANVSTTVTGTFTEKSLNLGSLRFLNFAPKNVGIANNIYFDGTNFRYTADGFGTLSQYEAGVYATYRFANGLKDDVASPLPGTYMKTDGLYGIGTITPLTALDVNGDIRSNQRLLIQKNGSDTEAIGPHIRLANAAGTETSLIQLNAANGTDFWSYDTSQSPPAWRRNITINKDGSLKFWKLTSGGSGALLADASGNITKGSAASGDALLAGNPQSFTGKNNFTKSGTADSVVTIGGLEIQPVALNNNLIMDNLYFDGTNFKYRANGFASALQITNGSFILYTAISGTAGANATLVSGFQAENIGVVNVKALRGSSSAPSTIAGTGAGTTPTISVVGNDTAGLITITTGSSPATSSVIVTLTLSTSFASAPYPLLQPANATASALTAAAKIYPTRTINTLVLNSGSTALTGATSYSWFYHIIG